MSKKENKLKTLPEVTEDARDRFYYDKTPVIEKVVNRGDARTKFTPVAGDLTDKDIQDLARHAITIIDKTTYLEDPEAALKEAASLSVGSYSSGKWQDKLQPATMDLLVRNIEEMLTDKDVARIKAKDTQSTNKVDMTKKEAAQSVVEFTPTGRMKKVTPTGVSKALKEKPTPAKRGIRKMIGKGTPVIVLAQLIDNLDKVASQIEGMGNVDLATEVDKVANALESFSSEVAPLRVVKEKLPEFWALISHPEKLESLGEEDYKKFYEKLEGFLDEDQGMDEKDVVALRGHLEGLEANSKEALKKVLAILSKEEEGEDDAENV